MSHVKVEMGLKKRFLLHINLIMAICELLYTSLSIRLDANKVNR